jgi:CPA2 family monovalent cation:H+ antiporter-2
LEEIADWAEATFELPEQWTKTTVVAAAALLAAPFVIGLVRVARYLGFELACRAFPAPEGTQLDLAAAPRRMLVVTLQLAIVLLVGLPLVAITQPFLPAYAGAAVLSFVLLLLAMAFWRGASNFQGHTRAAAQALAESISRQTRHGRAVGATQQSTPDVERLDQLFAGFGSPVPVEVQPGVAAVGKTLADIRLRGLTGATVLAIQRGQESIAIPSGHEQLQVGDILAITGTLGALEAAKDLLAVPG